jgi:hypothetical protein
LSGSSTSFSSDRPADYAELLRRGHVSSPDGADPEEWRQDMRRQARQDKVRVSTSRDGDRAFAMLNHTIPADQEMEVMREALDRTTIFGEIAQRSHALGHQPGIWLRHDDESITRLPELWRPDLRQAPRAAQDRGRRSAHRPVSERRSVVGRAKP